jgi:hypothetical protein
MPIVTTTRNATLHKKAETIKIAPNSVVSSSEMSDLDNCENLLTADLSGCQLANTLPRFVSCERLTTINLSNTSGYSAIHDVPNVDWGHLTKVSVINLASCGLNVTGVDSLVKWLSNEADRGLGSSVITAKSIVINGNNARLTVSDTSVLAAKNNLIAKGWTLTHN